MAIMESCFRAVEYISYSKICTKNIFVFFFFETGHADYLHCSQSFLFSIVNPPKEWHRVKCLLKKISSMPLSVRATMVQHLEEGTTFIYHLTQTQVAQVTVISATRISFPPDSRTHSSRELHILT